MSSEELEELRKRFAELMQENDRLRRDLKQAQAGDPTAEMAGLASRPLAQERSPAFLEIVLQQVPTGVVIAEAPSGRIISANQKGAQIWRHETHVAGSTNEYQAYKGFHPDGSPYRAEEWPLARSVMKGEVVEGEEIHVRRGDGTPATLMVRSAPVYDAEGQRIAGVALFSDISEQVEARESVRKSERHLRDVLNSLFIYVGVLTPEGVVIETNLAPLKEDGFTQQEVYGKRFAETGWWSYSENAQRQIRWAIERAAAGTTSRFDIMGMNQRGEWIDLDFMIAPLHDEHQQVKYLIASAVNITPRKRAERAMEESEARLRIALAQAGVTVFSQDLQLRYLWDYNPHPNFPEPTHPYQTDFDLFNEQDARKLTGIKRQVLERGEKYHQEVTLTIDEELCHFDLVIEPVVNALGEISGLLGSALDISERKKIEEKLQANALRLERSNNDLEAFAYVASHDLQEPLRKVQAFGDLLSERFTHLLGDEGIEYIQRMQNATERMQQLIDNLLAYARVATKGQSMRMTDLNQVAQEVLIDLEMRIQETGGRVEVSPLPVMFAAPLQMHQLLLNLVGNALKFHRPGVPPVVRVGAQTPNSNEVVLYVEDNGIGFNMANLERVFQPFQRLHGRSEYEGSGIGLAICRKIVEHHQGTITARSQPGAGATFYITLPLKTY